jgi:hypothetical protein
VKRPYRLIFRRQIQSQQLLSNISYNLVIQSEVVCIRTDIGTSSLNRKHTAPHRRIASGHSTRWSHQQSVRPAKTDRYSNNQTDGQENATEAHAYDQEYDRYRGSYHHWIQLVHDHLRYGEVRNSEALQQDR